MTIVNKKSAPVNYHANRHYKATDQIAVGKEGTVSGQVGQEGGLYLLRTKENPHNVEWVKFTKS